MAELAWIQALGPDLEMSLETYTKTYESTLTPKRIKIEELEEENARLPRETTEMKSTMFHIFGSKGYT